MHTIYTKKIIFTLIVAPLLFMVAMVGVQLIPNSWVIKNVEKSQAIIQAESVYHDAYYVPQAHWLAGSDGYSDDIFLEQQIADRSHGLLYGAMMPSYDRYWHGYSVFLRPLLVFFDLSYIRQILVLCFIVLLIILVHLIAKYVSLGVGILFGIALALVNPPVIMISLQYSNMFLLMLAASIILMLLLAKKRPKHEIFIFFAVAGSLTSFFDLLTTPSITLGVPLLLYVLYRIKHRDETSIIKDVLLCAAVWGGGYFITWFGKWLLGSIILNRNIFAEATEKVLFWSSDSSTITKDSVSVGSVFTDWYERLVIYWPLFIMTIFWAMYGFVARLVSKRSFAPLRFKFLLALLIPTLIPVVWIVVARQHSFNHQWFSYRHLIVLLFGIFSITWYISRPKASPSLKKAMAKTNKKVRGLTRTALTQLRTGRW